jgi:hypothetical protein
VNKLLSYIDRNIFFIIALFCLAMYFITRDSDNLISFYGLCIMHYIDRVKEVLKSKLDNLEQDLFRIEKDLKNK